MKYWQGQCPLTRLEKYLRDENLMADSDFEKMESEISQEIRAAFDFALSGPMPKIEDTPERLYAR